MMNTKQNFCKNQGKSLAAIALLFILINASLGVSASLYIPGLIGQVIYVTTRLILLSTPIAWFVLIDKGKLQVKWPTRQDLIVGTVVGLLMTGVIAIAYITVGKTLIDTVIVQEAAEKTGLTNPWLYVGFGAYFTLINAFVEEYTWRWFVYQKCAVIFKQKQAIYIAAFGFTIHHIIILAGYTSNVLVTVLGSLGVFLAGSIWSWCLSQYKSLWGCYFSHAFADLAIALIGWQLLFSS